MPQLDPDEVAKLRQTLDAEGEALVRTKFANRAYGNRSAHHVQNWLDDQDRNRQAARDAEQTEIAKSAKDAAWASANAAERSATEAHHSNRWAKAALVTAVIALLVAVAGLFLR